MWSAPKAIPQKWRRAGVAQYESEIDAHAKSDKPCFKFYEANNQERIMTFAEVHTTAITLANTLRSLAVSIGSLSSVTEDKPNIVGLILKRSPALAIGQLSSFKAGSTFVPCDPVWPATRTVEILNESEAQTMVSNGTSEEFEQLRESLKSAGFSKTRALVHVDNVANILNISFIGDVVCEFTPPSRAMTKEWLQPEIIYIMYTSGSTGKPKGCLVPATGVLNRCVWGVTFCGHTSDDVFLHKTPLTFDVSIPEIWSPLRLGATSVIVPDGAHMDFVVVKEVMEKGKVTVAEFVPSIFAIFLDFISVGDLPDLRQVICAGEALLVSHQKKLHQKLGRKIQFLNLYGPTEASIEVLGLDCTGDVEGVTHGFPIGQGTPPPGCLIYIVDQNDPTKLMPDGEVGELCLGGIQIAYGYVNRPDLTEERFMPNPFGEGQIYRTGDLSTRDQNGFIKYSGRADRQVKLNGVRIELGEIETVLQKKYHCLKSAAVEVVKGSMVAVTVPAAGAEVPSEEEMRQYLGSVLPGSHVPTEWHILDEIPTSSAGKTDHKQVVAWIEDQQKAKVWGSIYDEMYFADDFQVADGVDDPTMDWAAYYDSFTGSMHERNTIEEWVAETVNEVALYKPKKVMEMGCGKGMILFKMAAIPSVKSLVCCDLSAMAIKHVDKLWQWMHEKGHVVDGKKEVPTEGPTPINADCSIRTYVRDASNYAGIGDLSLDAVVCNGVAMHFPSAKYLVEVLQKGLPKIATNGKFHLGDIISLAHQPLFLLRRARTMDNLATYEKLQEKDFRAEILAGAKDRAYDHRLFYSLMKHAQLPGVAAVEVQLKHGEIMSEFSRYRYNVILHRGEASEVVQPLIAVPADVAQKSTSDIISSCKTLAASNPSHVIACHSIPNARLTADIMLRNATKDAAAPAVQLGANESGGVCPSELRKEFASQFPNHHAILTWSKDGCEDHMDLYALPLGAAGLSDISAGLRAIEQDALASVSSFQIEAWRDDVDSFSNILSTVDEKPKEASADVLQEVRGLWEDGKREDALLRLMGDKLSLPGKADAEADFKLSGGNSFVAMAIVGAIRKEFGVSAAVFELITLPLGKFAKAVVDKYDKNKTGASKGDWLVELKGKEYALGEGQCPTVVLFPQAGSGPSQYAGVTKEFLKGCPRGKCLIVQPPGREGRAGEPNIKDNRQYITEVSTALRPHLTGDEKLEGPVTFLGDSWGSIACFCVLHELREKDGFTPVCAVFSGDACPAIATTQNGMGSYSDASVAKLSDSEMYDFMKATGAAIVEDDDQVPDKVILDALQSDMLLYEQFKRPVDLKLLKCGVVTIRGEKDGVVTAQEMLGWLDEFETTERQAVTVAGASHHVHAEHPSDVAKVLLRSVLLN